MKIREKRNNSNSKSKTFRHEFTPMYTDWLKKSVYIREISGRVCCFWFFGVFGSRLGIAGETSVELTLAR
jgi:hypothetical protein